MIMTILQLLITIMMIWFG